MSARNKTLDGARGCLALLVLVNHALQYEGYRLLNGPAAVAVLTFFFISGYVLTPVWDGHYGAFLLRRAVRLWPIYALCLAAGALLTGERLQPTLLIWLPIAIPGGPHIDPPAWSLSIEWWAMLLMPAYVWVSRRGPGWLLAVSFAVIAGTFVAWWVLYVYGFFLGAWATRYRLEWAPLEGRVAQWLGRVSYPLYLSHWLVICETGLPLWASVPLSLAVAELLTRTVEVWSIRASRAAGRLVLPRVRVKRDVLQTS